MNYELYTDGACQPNPGFGGWAFILKCGENKTIQYGHEKESTNNRMEMLAVIRGIEEFIRITNTQSSKLCLYSDSKYLIDGIVSWRKAWVKNGWAKKNGDEILNKDLWMRIDSLVDSIQLECIHIRGHSGHIYNEEVDRLAVGAIEKGKNQNA